MKALLLFHLRVGIRVAVRSFTPLFAGLLVVIILQMYPAALVTSVARRIFAVHPEFEDLFPVILLSLALPAWAVPQLALGLNGWMRHLPISPAENRRGLACALAAVQMPLAVSILCLALVARGHGLAVASGLLRFLILLVSAAGAAMPVRRQAATVPLCLAAALLSISQNMWLTIPAIGLLAAADFIAGPLRSLRKRKPWRAAGSFLDFRIASRALGWRAPGALLAGIVPIGAAALFISNNELRGSLAQGAARFGGALAVLVVISGLARRLAIRRPPWPLARSFPWSAAHRVASDSVFLGVHALPLVAASWWLDPSAVGGVLALLPFLAIRAAGGMRRMPERRTGSGGFIAEGFFISGLFALLGWTSLVWLAAAPFAFLAARRADLHQKVTRWLDLHYATVGDSLSWGD